MKKEDIYNIREFDRFYTNVLQLTDKYHLHTKFTILESRILLEINRGVNTANQLLSLLKLDKGYISRVLKKLETENLITKKADSKDLRIKVLALTDDGKQALEDINQRADNQIDKLFSNVSESEIPEIIDAMKKIQTKLNQ
ncbi:MarR family winged helix-turn-helix transcriptional regulator [Companilactobacillus sp.]|jgi:DNA-binding MarR family transcriptional regulator|uniref:MarR family winged helix-turn-helix transcriptional regulator n=1 Tax=Companilactobacillus sp. TaxID=2767905 RepID=UPI0025BC6BC8|nr:MarR family transcriptional regulator [Companilactobacillus sp.]MCH4008774.1 MarR family transcriptional regulator [Companilactobacillus sp.]MCH4051047.1 MarR family transcriptional regulator [Companilactobacillus sp.]MCH4076717.1 MarR family transcriptional regulator [Companilactobacillus sp.]MCH4125292.1 MarR family transcriptional regulator [Companilactobacillus sp.]MCH4131832.1 MarR family transcriptional regulator [Companilactobacillus sp.]